MPEEKTCSANMTYNGKPKSITASDDSTSPTGPPLSDTLSPFVPITLRNSISYAHFTAALRLRQSRTIQGTALRCATAAPAELLLQWP